MLTMVGDDLTAMTRATSVDVVVVAYDSGEDLYACLASLCDQETLGQVIVVDNGPEDTSVDPARCGGAVIRAQHENLGFAGGANYGATWCEADIVLFLNPDTILPPGAVKALGQQVRQHPGVAGLPVVHTIQSDRPEYGGTIDVFGFPTGLGPFADRPLFVSGCCLATNRAVFESLGGFDSRYFMFVEDVEYCWRCLRAGYEVTVLAESGVKHGGGGSTPGGYLRRGRLETTATRIILRERNTLAMFLACAPASVLALVVFLSVARSLATAAWLARWGHWRPAQRVLGTVGWNIRQLPGTLGRRWSLPEGSPAGGAGWDRVRFACFALTALRRVGPPEILPEP
jgi:N-acetylglucosaminyl-diphospho-decaprenol L-rhamnosyltransferase